MSSKDQSVKNKLKKFENAYINELVKKAQQDDEGAFTELVHLFQPKVHYIIKRYIREQVDIADVSQEVFIKVHKYIKGFKGDSSFYTWLFSVTTSVVKNHLLIMKKTQLLTTIDGGFTDYMEFAIDVHENIDPQDILVSDETENTLIETLENLPKILREVIVLRELEGLSYVNISNILILYC